MSKFFINKKQIENNMVTISDVDAKHIATVLRHKLGDVIQVCDGDCHDYVCKIIEIKKDLVCCEIIESKTNEAEPNTNIILYQGVPKSDKMDLIIQKCVELGIQKIVPVITEHTVVKIDKDSHKKIERWQKISESAAKQSGRGIVPEIGDFITFKEAVRCHKNIGVIPYEKERQNTLSHFTSNIKGQAQNIDLFIGPEGGFSEKEIQLSINQNVMPVSLGKRILRSETAGFVALTILLYELG